MHRKLNLSFAGCGFLGIYHVGVAICFKKYAPHLLLNRISGASAGALAACCLLCDMPLGEMTSDFFRVVEAVRQHKLGPFNPRFDIQKALIEGLEKFLPEDAHKRVNGKLHISLTRLYDGKNVIVSQFNSRADLLQALLCACFIPVFSGLVPPRFHGIRYMDGAFSDNLPTLDENTVTVSPFCGESDICPRDNNSQIFHVNWANTSIEVSPQNLTRFGRILFPPNPENLSTFCQQGFNDALNYLRRNNLLSCSRCLTVQTTYSVAEDQPRQQQQQQPDVEPVVDGYDPECGECDEHRRDAINGTMPETVLTVFQAYIDAANQEVEHWIAERRKPTLRKALLFPARLPVEMMMATLNTLYGITKPSMCFVGKFAIDVVRMIVQRFMGEEQVLSKLAFSVVANLCDHWNPGLPVRVTGTLECKTTYRQYTGGESKLLGTRTKRLGQHASRGSLVDVRVDNGNQLVARPGTMAIGDTVGLQMNHKHQQDRPMLGREVEEEVHPDYDTFEHILKASYNHDAMYAYYYMDSNNKVQVVEIFDLTDDDSPAIQTEQEREANQQLEFDSDWETTQPGFLYPDACDRDRLMDLDELIEPCLYPNLHPHSHHYRNVYGHPNECTDPAAESTQPETTQHWPQLQIEELPSDDTLYLQPEADQQQALLSEAATLALSKPPSYSIVDM